MTTMDNLKEAFAGESQANRTYLAFAKKADADGYPHVARLFRAAAAAETVHAHAHLRVLGGVKDTAGNLEAAVAGEGHEFQEMYPTFIREALAEDNKAALVSFKAAMAVEEIHHSLYSKALESISSGRDLPERALFVCEICGNTVYDEAPEKCPICNAPKLKFFEVV
ncbi:rubrerythrin family protein [Candidatus Bipolaricaulota bacterium]|jgi:rubrerythrin|nr:rubrerythrin family protein [Candidatus Bipolaricaulota bacterium]TFH11033.1 MAG: rubrerythrin family protein [Candidatus Atribacteria bacterium]